MALDTRLARDIADSRQTFDLGVPLTREELIRVGLLGVLPGVDVPAPGSAESFPVIEERELEDEVLAAATDAVDAVGALVASEGYNARYQHYLRCQAIATLVAFAEGWSAFEELVLKAYVDAQRREDAGYRGDDANKAFVLRVKARAAEDFLTFIRVSVVEAATTPKPILMKET